MVHFRVLTLGVLIATSGGWTRPSASAEQEPEIRVLSSRPDAVSGGTALVQLDTPGQSNWTVLLNDRDVTVSFRRSERTGTLLAPLKGLRIGKNTLEVRVRGTTRSKIQILNHPLAGPIFSGPHQQPFICQTEANGLGPAQDADCAAKTLVQYYYKSSEPTQMPAGINPTPAISAPGFKLYDPSGPRPSDVARAVMPDGGTVDYIVRREVGVINRAAYEILFLHTPGGPLPTPWTYPSPGWNGRLVYTFGGGCRAGYRQGILHLGMHNFEPILAQGYALATSSLNILDNNCNENVSAETASMVKEHFIEQYGEPAYTIGVGGSSGAVAVYLTAQNYPGILDGIIPFASVPDHTSVMPTFSDCALLDSAFKKSRLVWTEVQKTAISGFATWQACATAASVLPRLGWLDPKVCDSSLPKEMIYDRISNPSGARCTFYDNAVNVFGRDSKTGFARRTLDGVGIQYGLVAFNAGKIDAQQFIDLNGHIGGYDPDGQIVATRTVADTEGLRMAYERGLVVTGKTLSELPIIDWNEYADDLGDIHTRDRAFITRSRLIAANGDAGNQAILVTPRPGVRDIPGVGLHFLVPAMDRWLASIEADPLGTPLLSKIIRNKPAELADGCIAVDGERIAEPATYHGPGRCNRMYPSHGNPRVAAGAPIGGDILKCALKPVDPADYAYPLTPDQLKRLKGIFPEGVCDYSKPGIGQQMSTMTWQRF